MEAQAHMTFELLFKVGILPVSIVGEPGNHGAGVTGMHGTGVGMPIFAAVAAMNVGLAGQMHIPKGGIFAIGAELIMLEKGIFTTTPVVGKTLRVEGASPKGHVSIALVEMPKAISTPSIYC